MWKALYHEECNKWINQVLSESLPGSEWTYNNLLRGIFTHRRESEHFQHEVDRDKAKCWFKRPDNPQNSSEFLDI